MVDDKLKKKHLPEDKVSKAEKGVDTMDIYNDDQRSEMLKRDEITTAEDALIQGREMKPEDIKKTKKIVHDDSVSVELSKIEI